MRGEFDFEFIERDSEPPGRYHLVIHGSEGEAVLQAGGVRTATRFELDWNEAVALFDALWLGARLAEHRAEREQARKDYEARTPEVQAWAERAGVDLGDEPETRPGDEPETPTALGTLGDQGIERDFTAADLDEGHDRDWRPEGSE
jgi:hypothetical protein